MRGLVLKKPENFEMFPALKIEDTVGKNWGIRLY